jgi:hypothetical protein
MSIVDTEHGYVPLIVNSIDVRVSGIFLNLIHKLKNENI